MKEDKLTEHRKKDKKYQLQINEDSMLLREIT
jgi:hypothetical protein